MRKKILLIFCICACCAWNSAAQDYFYGLPTREASICINGETKSYHVVCANHVDSPAWKAGIHYFDVILSVDGEPYNMENLGKKSSATFQVKRTGNQTLNITVQGVPTGGSHFVTENQWALLDHSNGTLTSYSGKTLDIEPIEIFADPEADLYSYATYDFEWTDRNTIQQKEIAALLEPLLAEKNLKRDRENPDILIYIEFFSDRREQYVPPTQQITTRYRYGYEVGDGWGTRRYTESETVGNYTRVEYLSKLALMMVDAQKVRTGATVLPVIWSANYEVIYDKKAELKPFTENIGRSMFNSFPIKAVYRTDYQSFWAIGVLWDRDVPGRVIYVFPNSPAANGGIRAGDVILKSKPGTKLDRKYDDVAKQMSSVKTNHTNHGDFALTRLSNSIYDFNNQTIAKMYFAWTNGYYYYEIKGSDITFTVLGADGQKRKVSVKPKKMKLAEYYWK